MEWWQDPNDPDYFSNDFLLEQEKMQADFASGKETRIERAGGWFDPFWVKSPFLKLGHHENKLYWTVGIIFGKEIPVARKLREKPQVSIEWETEVWQLRIEYPEDYPVRAPRVYIEKPKLSRFLGAIPHTLIGTGGALCMFDPRSGREYGWNPNTGTAATITLWAIEWICAYRQWKETGTWPGKSAY